MIPVAESNENFRFSNKTGPKINDFVVARNNKHQLRACAPCSAVRFLRKGEGKWIGPKIVDFITARGQTLAESNEKRTPPTDSHLLTTTYQNGTRMLPNCYQNGTKIIAKRYQHYIKIVQNVYHQNGTRTVPNLYKIGGRWGISFAQKDIASTFTMFYVSFTFMFIKITCCSTKNYVFSSTFPALFTTPCFRTSSAKIQ